MKQKHKGVILTRRRCVNNILTTYYQRKEGDLYDWYVEARVLSQQLAFDRPFSASQCAGVISALSPLKSWDENIKIAHDFIEYGIRSHMFTFVEKAELIMNCDGTDEAILDILNGRKISAFYLNIMGRSDVVTIDRHALSVVLGRDTNDNDYAGMTARQYAFFQECYITAAYKMGIVPSMMQSVTWLVYRRNKLLN